MRYLSLIFTLIFWGITAMAIEKPEYHVLETHENFELRKYDSYIVAETEITGNFDDVGNKAFRILFNYISGANQTNQKIKMTAPVEQSAKKNGGEKIKMTAPVIQESAGDQSDRYVIGFVMPSKYTMETIPEPTDSSITLRKTQEKLVAAHKYSGTWSEKRYRKHEAILLDSLKNTGFQIIGNPIYARYNPPFMPWFLRRNEVLIEVERPASTPQYTNQTNN